MSNLLLARSAQMGRHPLLPKEYQQVEYIESTGTQWIDTGVPAVSGLRAEFKIYSDRYSSFDGIVLGTRLKNGDRMYFLDAERGKYCYGYGSYENANFLFVNGVAYDINAILKRNEQRIIVDDTEILHRNLDITVNAVGNLFLFICNYVNSTNSNPFLGKVYYCRIYRDDLPLRNLIPCINNLGNAGMYDLVSRSFFPNSGTGSFLFGNNIR